MSFRAKNKILIVPCSGIGKTYGSVSREAAYIVQQELHPQETQIVPLSLLVLGDEETCATTAGRSAITIDGCKLACATKMIQQSGGKILHNFDVLDVFRRYRDFKPQGIAELNEGGQKLAQALAEEISAEIEQMNLAGEAEHA